MVKTVGVLCRMTKGPVSVNSSACSFCFMPLQRGRGDDNAPLTGMIITSIID